MALVQGLTLFGRKYPCKGSNDLVVRDWLSLYFIDRFRMKKVILKQSMRVACDRQILEKPDRHRFPRLTLSD